MIPVGWIGRPIGIGVVRRYDFDQTRWFSYPVKLADEGHDVGNVFNYVAADNQIEFIVGKRIRQNAEIVNDVCVSSWIGIYANGAGVFVLATADVENLHGWLKLVLLKKEISE
jgi:hypothetical protein